VKWTVGDVVVTKIVEAEVTGGSFLLLQATPQALEPLRWLWPHFVDEIGRLRLSVQSFVVETSTGRVIVDTCLGNDKQGRPFPEWNDRHGPFLDDLASAGFSAESIDTVLCTHLHVDHVGWNTRNVGGTWVPTFPRARYLIAQKEYDYWCARNDRPDTAQILSDSVTPVVEAGLATMVTTDARLGDELMLVPTPGHTPGSFAVLVKSRGEEALITGDFVHHPCQIAHPEWSSVFDTDPVESIATRRRIFERMAGSRALLIGTHFTGASVGRIVSEGDTFRLEV
jgi:glyoxylase-like metal-dependent hydrolase (beta-lactamase superfamily II)